MSIKSIYDGAMRRAFLCLLGSVAFAGAGCTKPNPKNCGDGSCTDPAFPFCDVDGSVGGEPNTCIAVTCTPGQLAECRGDVAVTCNAGGNNYDEVQCALGCDASKGCVSKCVANTDCTSGICKSDGSCADASEITFVDPAGLDTADCSMSAPCSIIHALSLQPSATGQFVKLAPGEYRNTQVLTLNGHRTLIGSGSTMSSISRSNAGPIITVDAGAEVLLSGVRIADATNSPGSPFPGDGVGINCPNTSLGPRKLTLVDSAIANNASYGMFSTECTTTISRSAFTGNYSGASLEGEVSIDACLFTDSLSGALAIAGAGNHSVTNTFIVRNNSGVVVTGPPTPTVFAFNTVVDNTQLGFECDAASGVSIAASNNIIARNQTNTQNTSGTPCTFPGSIISDSVTALHFKSSESAPFDYHLSTGSVAIDAALADSLDHDFDGDVRPKGNGRDIGADEAC